MFNILKAFASTKWNKLKGTNHLHAQNYHPSQFWNKQTPYGALSY